LLVARDAVACPEGQQHILVSHLFTMLNTPTQLGVACGNSGVVVRLLVVTVATVGGLTGLAVDLGVGVVVTLTQVRSTE